MTRSSFRTASFLVLAGAGAVALAACIFDQGSYDGGGRRGRAGAADSGGAGAAESSSSSSSSGDVVTPPDASKGDAT